MAENAGYDQPGDGYTNEHTTFGVDIPLLDQPGIPTLQQDVTQQPNLIQQLDANNTNTTVANSLTNDGYYESTRRMSNNAMILLISSVIVGIIWLILIVVLALFVVQHHNNFGF